jgi:hypothetical protein
MTDRPLSPDALNSLYDHPDSQAAAARAQAGRTAPAPTSSPDASTPPSAPTSNAEMAETLFGGTYLAAQIDHRDEDMFSSLGWAEPERASFKQDFLDLRKATGLPEPVVVLLANKFIDGKIAQVRAADPAKHQAEINQRVDESIVQLRANLRTKHGAKQGEALLARTLKFARSNPHLAEVLQAFNLGADPDVVEAIVDHVSRSGYR